MDNYVFKLGDEVDFNLGPMLIGHGVICGVATTSKLGIGHTYIIEDKSGNVHNKAKH